MVGLLCFSVLAVRRAVHCTPVCCDCFKARDGYGLC